MLHLTQNHCLFCNTQEVYCTVLSFSKNLLLNVCLLIRVRVTLIGWWQHAPLFLLFFFLPFFLSLVLLWDVWSILLVSWQLWASVIVIFTNQPTFFSCSSLIILNSPKPKRTALIMARPLCTCALMLLIDFDLSLYCDICTGCSLSWKTSWLVWVMAGKRLSCNII